MLSNSEASTRISTCVTRPSQVGCAWACDYIALFPGSHSRNESLGTRLVTIGCVSQCVLITNSSSVIINESVMTTKIALQLSRRVGQTLDCPVVLVRHLIVLLCWSDT